jgi:prepilin-type N-terminal cleavage/methylation domain-containing protein
MTRLLKISLNTLLKSPKKYFKIFLIWVSKILNPWYNSIRKVIQPGQNVDRLEPEKNKKTGGKNMLNLLWWADKLRKNQKGFTLVELMVVVVIIGVLVAIAVPIFGGVQQRARDTAHEANERILIGAAAMYLSEHGNPDPALTGIGDGDELDPYLDAWPEDPYEKGQEYSVDIDTDGTITVSLD